MDLTITQLKEHEISRYYSPFDFLIIADRFYSYNKTDFSNKTTGFNNLYMSKIKYPVDVCHRENHTFYK